MAVIDLSPLRDVEWIDIQQTKIADYSVLRNFSLKTINCDKPLKGELKDVLKTLPKLEQINGASKAESLK